MKDSASNYLSLREAADDVGLNIETIRRHIRKGTLQIEHYGNVRIIHKKELHRWHKEDYIGRGKASDKWRLEKLRQSEKADN